jgi:hypothetical protein
LFGIFAEDPSKKKMRHTFPLPDRHAELGLEPTADEIVHKDGVKM